METIPAEEVNQNRVDVEELIAELCLNCNNNDLKHHLQIYEYGRESTEIKKRLHQLRNDQLTSMLIFLNNDVVNEPVPTLKKDLVNDIFCRIQNLLPDTCGMCTQRFKLKFDEYPVLQCASCLQSSHRECVQKLLNSSPHNLQMEDIKYDNAKLLFNPMNIPGVHYLCKACDDTIIPTIQRNSEIRRNSAVNIPQIIITSSPETPLTEAETGSAPVDEAVVSTAEPHPLPPTEEENQPQPSSAPLPPNGGQSTTPAQAPLHSQEAVQQASNTGEASHQSALTPAQQTNLTALIQGDQHERNPNNREQLQAGGTRSNSTTNQASTTHPGDRTTHSTKSNQVCRYYDKSSCKHGVSGENCNFIHPEICRKYKSYGSRQPRGCNLGKRCKYFHPTMCMDSLRREECLNPRCSFRHVIGTKRLTRDEANSQSTTPSAARRRSTNTTSNSNRENQHVESRLPPSTPQQPLTPLRDPVAALPQDTPAPQELQPTQPQASQDTATSSATSTVNQIAENSHAESRPPPPTQQHPHPTQPISDVTPLPQHAPVATQAVEPQPQSQDTNFATGHFLELFRLMQAETLKEMDKRIGYTFGMLSSQFQNTQHANNWVQASQTAPLQQHYQPPTLLPQVQAQPMYQGGYTLQQPQPLLPHQFLQYPPQTLQNYTPQQTAGFNYQQGLQHQISNQHAASRSQLPTTTAHNNFTPQMSQLHLPTF